MIVCVLVPRFALAVAAGARAELLQSPAVLAPEPGGGQRVGEVSPAAEAFGIRPGMMLGEALARCRKLILVPPDPAGVEERWDRLLVCLESIGAAVEPERPGRAFFDARALFGLHGGSALPGAAGDRERVLGVLAAVRRALRGVESARFGVAPSRFAAVAAASRARMRRPEIIAGGQPQAAVYLATHPVSLLRSRTGLEDLPEGLERLGIRTLGELAELPAAAVADRFGPLGRSARELACGGDTPLRPRVPSETLRESLDLPEAVSGQQLERAVGMLIDRLLACGERRGRTFRAVVLSASLVEGGGTWRERVVFREALADPVRMRLVLTPRLEQMPAPAETLRLAVDSFGPPAGDQRGLLDDPAAARRLRLREAIRQTRSAAGMDAALRVLEIDPGSRVPERRAVLTPFEG